MSRTIRSLACFALLCLAALAGCSESHGPTSTVDGGLFPPDGGGCTGTGPLCPLSCGSDALMSPICVDGAWACPPGSVDIRTCPPSCGGPSPGPSCHCEGTEWVCETESCPPGINPWDPSSPASECSPNGRHCQDGGLNACGSFISCDCEEGHWNCLVAEPDPVCWCGRQPSAGDACSEEGATCGECCPTAGGTGWDPMSCVDGHWEPLACADLVCPPVVAPTCPVDREAALGTPCSSEGLTCGNACCDRGFMCNGGVWVIGPEVDCLVCDPTASYACGEGTCESTQACTSQCGPADGTEHTCTLLEPGCSSCDCTFVPPGFTCEVRDEHVFLTMEGFCG